jgi:predicted DNA-binding transcriptional regulator AlpA
MSLDLDLLRAGLAAVASLPGEIPADQLPELVGDLARAQAALLTAASHAPAVAQREVERPNEDRMLDVNEAAALLRVTPRWLYRHGDLPFTRRISRKVVRYSRAGIQRWLAARRT